MRIPLGAGALCLLLATGLGCATEDGVEAPNNDALLAALPQAAQLTEMKSGLAYGDRIAFSYSKRQTQLSPGYAFATRLFTQQQDSITVRLFPGSLGNLYLLDRTAGRYQTVAVSAVATVGATLDLKYAVQNPLELWAVFVPTLADAQNSATSAIQLRATPGTPWTPAYAAAVRDTLLGADSLQMPWSRLAISSSVSTVSPTILEGAAKMRVAQLEARAGVAPNVYRWNFQGRDLNVVQSTSLLDGTLDIYMSGGRWLTGAKLRRDSLNVDISSAFIEWTDL